MPKIRGNSYIEILFTCAVGLAIGSIHLYLVYPIVFHSDAAAMQVLARSILEECKLLPQDFYFGNQLILFRSSPFIALALRVGFTGYDAFAFGSMTSFAFWFTLSTAIIKSITKEWHTAIIFAAAMFIPFGMDTADYLIGQQSHLANLVFSIIIVTQVYRIMTQDGDSGPIILFVVALLLMTAEEPKRTLLVVFPLLIVVSLSVTYQVRVKIISFSFVSTLAGYAINLYLRAGDRISPDLGSKFASVNSAISGIIPTFINIIQISTSIDLYARRSLHLAITAFYLLSWAYVFLSIVIFIIVCVKIFKVIAERCTTYKAKTVFKNFSSYIIVVSVVGIIVDFFFVVFFSPDGSRHFLWALSTFKLASVMLIYGIISSLFDSKRISAGITILLSLFLSCWFAMLILGNISAESVNKGMNREFSAVLRPLMNHYGTNRIYGGDFWRVTRLSVDVDAEVAAPLRRTKVGFQLDPWLIRPSWAECHGNVLYVLSNNGTVDSNIASVVQNIGGTVVFKDAVQTVLFGPPIWSTR